jgi:hypothetical protein
MLFSFYIILRGKVSVLIASAVADGTEDTVIASSISDDNHQAETLDYDNLGQLDRAQLGRQVATLGTDVEK